MRKKQYKDITGEKFGKLLILNYIETINKRPYWLCKCDCGNVVKKRGKELKSGSVKSCGCLLKERGPDKDITGKKFNYLFIIKCAGKLKNTSDYWWECKCDCGNITKVPHHKLISGHTKSCGCLHDEIAKINAIKRNKLMSGENHPRWRFDFTEKDRNETRYYNPKLFRWRNKVYKRDNFTCQKCKDDQGGNLVAHHIYSWDKYIKLRFITKNGLTLCENCHKDFHKRYGYGNNTKKQFNNWMKEIII